MRFELFIARRIYSDRGDRRKVSRPAVQIATLGVAIGLAVMIVTVSVVLGFKHSIRDKVVGFGSHIQVLSLLSIGNGDAYPLCVDSQLVSTMEHVSGVAHVQRFAMTQGILKTDCDFLGVAFKGIGPDYDTTFISNNLLEGSVPAFSDTVSSNKILISKHIASKLGVKVGERIFAYFIGNDDVRTRRFTVSGIYQTNMARFDQTLCITDIYTAAKLNGWQPDQCSGAELTVTDFERLNDVYAQIINKVNRKTDRYQQTMTSQTILEAYPQVFSWLELLDINVWIILALMVCLAAITMTSGLLIIILERTTMIGVLKALGARHASIRHTFLWFAVFIVGQGLVLGNVIGTGLVMLQRQTGLAKLDPQIYYVSSVPVEFNLPLVVLLNVATLLICVAVLTLPSFFISHIHPARAMRFTGE